MLKRWYVLHHEPSATSWFYQYTLHLFNTFAPFPVYLKCPQTSHWSLLIQQYIIFFESVWYFLYLYKKWRVVLLPELVIPLIPSGQIRSLGSFPAQQIWPQQICPMFESLLFDRLYPTIKHSKLAITHYFVEVSCVSPLSSFLELETLSPLFHFTLCLISSKEPTEFLPEVF